MVNEPVEQGAKAFWKSKTLWFNLLAAVVILAGYLGYQDFKPDATWLALVTAVINFVLRFWTDRPIGFADH